MREALDIHCGGLDRPEVEALLREHLRGMAALSPPESIHALGIDRLRGPDITFWSAWRAGDLLGCAALKQLAPDHGEIKSMRTAERHRGRGVASRLLLHLEEEARRRGYARLSLETGSMDGFAPARALYAKHGYVACAPFADYIDDPNSVFMAKAL